MSTVTTINHSDDDAYSDMKLISTSWTQNLSLSSAYWQELNGMTRGFDDTNRLGRSITMFKLAGAFSLYATTSASVNVLAGDVISVAIVYDKQVGNSAPSYSECFGGDFPLYTHGFRTDRYTILWHKIYAMQPLVTTTGNYTESGGNTTIVDSINLPLYNLRTDYNAGNTGLNDDMQYGCLYAVCYGRSLTSTTAFRITARFVLAFDDA